MTALTLTGEPARGPTVPAYRAWLLRAFLPGRNPAASGRGRAG